jgi:lipoprotein-anchoring transpeptidase ErfK/SrfK
MDNALQNLFVLAVAHSSGINVIRPKAAHLSAGKSGRARSLAAISVASEMSVSRTISVMAVCRASGSVKPSTPVLRTGDGRPSTPTPRGALFVEEAISLRPTEVGAPFALALSARSSVFQQFDGGPGQIALHGLTNVGGVLGTAASHGCVRLENGVMRWLVKRIRPGTTVTIRG